MARRTSSLSQPIPKGLAEAGLAAHANIVPQWKPKLFACIILRQPKPFPLDEQTANHTKSSLIQIHATHPHRKDTLDSLLNGPIFRVHKRDLIENAAIKSMLRARMQGTA